MIGIINYLMMYFYAGDFRSFLEFNNMHTHTQEIEKSEETELVYI